MLKEEMKSFEGFVFERKQCKPFLVAREVPYHTSHFIYTNQNG